MKSSEEHLQKMTREQLIETVHVHQRLDEQMAKDAAENMRLVVATSNNERDNLLDIIQKAWSGDYAKRTWTEVGERMDEMESALKKHGRI